MSDVMILLLLCSGTEEFDWSDVVLATEDGE